MLAGVAKADRAQSESARSAAVTSSTRVGTGVGAAANGVWRTPFQVGTTSRDFCMAC